MAFVVSDDCSKLGLRAGAITFQGVQITDSSSELRVEIAEEAKNVARRFTDISPLKTRVELTSLYDIYRKINISPRKEQPASQRLIQLMLKRGELPAINNLVDAYNLISVRSLCCLGAHDLDKLTLPVSLKLFDGSETFVPLGSQNIEKITPGEFGYVDASNRVLCRLDVLQGDFSKVTTTTTNVLLIIEGTFAHSVEEMEKVFSDAAQIIQRYCGGEAKVRHLPNFPK